MDPTTSVILTAQLTSFKGDILTQIQTILPIAIAILVTITLISVGISLFTHIAGVKRF